MAEAQWIKIATDVFENEKLLLIESMMNSKSEADSVIMIWFKLLTFAGKQNNSGVFMMGKIPYTEKMLSTIFHRDEDVVHLALQMFEQFGMIERVNDVITIPNWEKHQSLDKLEAEKEKTRNRVAKHREKQKALTTCNDDVTQCNVTVTLPVTECNAIDKNRIKKKEIKEEEEGEVCATPTSPTLEEISDYIHNNNLSVNPNRFFTYYDEREWKTAKGNPIKWEQKLQEWDYDEKQKAKANPNPASQTINNPFLALAKKENLI
jgi:predicted phage replisome organizer